MNEELTKAINYRADGTKYPVNVPEGWVHLPFAVDLFGGALLKEGYDFMMFKWAELDHPIPQQPTIDSVNQARIDYAKRHQRQFVDAFLRLLVSGDVKSGYSRVGGGRVEEMDPDWWRTDDPLLRFRSFSIDPDPAQIYSDRIDLPCWIWVDAESLGLACDLARRERNGWGPPPPTSFEPRTETYVEENGKIQHWVYDETGSVTIYSEEAPPPSSWGPGRPTKTPRIRKLFADRLRAGTVKERVSWEGKAIWEADRDNPDRADPDTCADRIRDYFKMIRRSETGVIVNVAEILEAMDYPINPDKSLAMPIKR